MGQVGGGEGEGEAARDKARGGGRKGSHQCPSIHKLYSWKYSLGKQKINFFFFCLMLRFNWLDCGAFLGRSESLVKGMFAIALV